MRCWLRTAVALIALSTGCGSEDSGGPQAIIDRVAVDFEVFADEFTPADRPPPGTQLGQPVITGSSRLVASIDAFVNAYAQVTPSGDVCLLVVSFVTRPSQSSGSCWSLAVARRRGTVMTLGCFAPDSDRLVVVGLVPDSFEAASLRDAEGALVTSAAIRDNGFVLDARRGATRLVLDHEVRRVKPVPC